MSMERGSHKGAGNLGKEHDGEIYTRPLIRRVIGGWPAVRYDGRPHAWLRTSGCGFQGMRVRAK